MLAYRVPDVAPAAAKELLIAGSHPGLARIALAGPWQFSLHPDGGTLCTWLGSTVPRPEELGEAVACADGLTYYRPKPLPTMAQLAKRLRVEHEIDVDLISGQRITIVLAAAAPRRLRFTGPTSVGEPSTEYGSLARIVMERLADKGRAITPEDDEDMRRLIVLAIAQRYRVTAELLDDLGWFTTDDIDPLLCAIMGSDPKASAAASGT